MITVDRKQVVLQELPADLACLGTGSPWRRGAVSLHPPQRPGQRWALPSLPASPFLGSFAEANCAPGGRSILLCFPDVALWKMEPRGMKGIYSCLVYLINSDQFFGSHLTNDHNTSRCGDPGLKRHPQPDQRPRADSTCRLTLETGEHFYEMMRPFWSLQMLRILRIKANSGQFLSIQPEVWASYKNQLDEILLLLQNFCKV